jgi:hypothetical protein
MRPTARKRYDRRISLLLSYCAMNKSISFAKWFQSNFYSPQAVLIEYLDDLRDTAASIGAALPADFISKLTISPRGGKPLYTYLPSIRGANDSKQFAYAFLGTTDYKKESVPVPIVCFGSFKLSRGHLSWSPSKRLTDDYKSSRHIIKYGANSTSNESVNISKYQSIIQNLEKEAGARNAEHLELIKRANKAAAELSLAQLRSGLVQQVTDPSSLFGIEGLSLNHHSEFICVKPITDLLYYQNERKWKEAHSASPRDLIIPMYDASIGMIQNLQKITNKPNGKSVKRFLAGGKLINQCAILSNKMIPEMFVVGEGYKTTRVLCETTLEITTVCAFSANNIPNIVRSLRNNYPNAIIFTAEDNDLDGLTYSQKAREESGSISIPPPQLFTGSDWADLAKSIGLSETISIYENHIRALC